MTSYGCSITQKNMAELEHVWRKRLVQVNSQLAEAETIREYLAVLQRQREWSSLGFCLRRYLYEKFTGRSREEAPVPFTVSLKGREYAFSSVTPEPPAQEEKERYAELLYQLTVENGCTELTRSGKRVGSVSKKLYLRYLENSSIFRKKLFVLSMALKFDSIDMEDFMNSIGEGPVYNFRSAEECIYYFCHNTPPFRSMADKRTLEQEYRRRLAAEGAAAASEQTVGATRLIRRGIDGVTYGEYGGEGEQREAFLQFLLENSPRLTEYSRTARRLLERELRAGAVLGFDYGILPAKVCSVVAGEELDLYSTREQMGTELYGELVEGSELEGWDSQERFQISEVALDRRITANLPDGAHLRGALSDEAGRRTLPEHVTKKDFLLLRLHKLGLTVDFSALRDEEQFELLQEFHNSTDRLLQEAGLPEIYAANPFDHMVLTALCSRDPLAFVPNILRMAPRREEAEEE